MDEGCRRGSRRVPGFLSFISGTADCNFEIELEMLLFI